jgi:class 3 adenylate cyclase/uncharacterized RDD family membrane protein YckC
MSTATVDTAVERSLATGGTRALALLVDLILITPFHLGVEYITYELLGIPQSTIVLPIDLFIQLLLDVPYFVGFWYFLGATPGKLALSIRVVDQDSHRRPALTRLLIRYLGYWVSLAALLLGFFAMRRHPRKQTWHDRWAKTVVIEVPLPNLQHAAVDLTDRMQIAAPARPHFLLTALILLMAAMASIGGVVTLLSTPLPLPERAYTDAIAAVLFRFFRVVVPLVQIGAGLAAALLIVRSGTQPAARALALTLAAYWVSTRLLLRLGVSEPLTSALAVATDWIALGALLRFIALFPRPMPTIVPEGVDDWSRAFDRLRVMVVWLIAKIFSRGRAVRSADAKSWVDRLSLDPRVVWGIVLAVGAATLVLASSNDGNGATWLRVIRAILFFALVIQAVRLLRLRYRSAVTDADSKRLLWLVNGVYLGLLLPFVLFAIAIVFAIAVGATGSITGTQQEVRWMVQSASFNAGILVARAPAILLTGFLIFAVFYRGALDPNLTIRKTTLYGALAVLAMILFAGFEYLVSSQIAGVLNLSDGTSNVLAGVLAAAAVAPVQGRMKSSTDRIFDRILPQRLNESERGVALVCVDIDETERSADASVVSLFHKEARASASRHDGRLADTIGNAVLLEFRSAKSALRALRDLRDRFAKACAVLGFGEFSLRSAAHSGMLDTDRDGNVSGDAVNLVARLQYASKPGEVLVTRAITEQSDLRGVCEFEDIGPTELNNLDAPVEAYRVLRYGPA